MTKINWVVRLKNKTFYLTVIPALLLLIQVVTNLFGYKITFEGVSDKLIAVVNAVFAVLTIAGVITDPTTSGFRDSERALTYKELAGPLS